MNQLFRDYDHFLLDLWGVLWDGRNVFHDAVQFCRELHRAGKNIRFVSNSAEYSPEELIDRLHRAGLVEAKDSWLATSGQAMKPWFDRHGITGKDVYVFGGKPVVENVRRAGAKILELPAEPENFVKQSDWLVIGGNQEFTWRQLQQMASCVKMGNLKIILPNPDKIVVRMDGCVSFPPGMMVEVIKIAVPDVIIEPIGKPFPFIYDYALSTLGLDEDRSRVLMIGDSLETDILGANRAGIDSLLLGQGVHLGQSQDQLISRSKLLLARPTYFVPELSSEAALATFA